MKVGVSALVGVVTLIVSGLLLNWRVAPLLAWDMAATVYVVWLWALIWPLNGRETAGHALREDPSRGITDTIVLFSSVASLGAVGVVLATASQLSGGNRLVHVALGIGSVIIAWLVVHTLFTLRYAELYYEDKPGGIDFGDTTRPAYHDFAYTAFTIGMTFQVSDTGLKNGDFRRTALHHALISYLFGTIIVATTINLIAGLTK